MARQGIEWRGNVKGMYLITTLIFGDQDKRATKQENGGKGFE